ncbi:MAG: SDR family NAD(P)-dependent oxidoreductase [Geminicoccaceae bacterium]|nr:SDR family NAD(P)-dependent oxidoreductase [Geminicoccaceae bacterium]
MPDATLKDRVLLVTGASRGIGRAVALAAAREGAQVVAVARTKAALEELDDDLRAEGHALTLLPLDLKDGDAVDRLGPSLYHRFGRLDGLVHAAAEHGPLTPTWQLDPKALEATVALHAFSAQRLIRTLDPVLKAGEGGAAVFLKDADVPPGTPFMAAYAAAKAALEAVVQAYAAELATPRLRVRLHDPGPTGTRLWQARYPGRPIAEQATPDERAPAILDLLRGG